MIGEDRPAGPLSELEHGCGLPGVDRRAHAGHDDDPSPPQHRREAAQLLAQQPEARGAPAIDRGIDGRQLTDITDQWLTEREVQMDRSGRDPSRPRPDVGGEVSPSETRAVIGRPGLDEPAHRPAEQSPLVDRLRSAHPVQLGWTIGRHRNERHVRLMCFDDRGVQLDRRGAARGQHDGRTTGREPEAEGEERGCPLVVVHQRRQRVVGGERQRQRGGPRARADDRVGHPEPRPLIRERGAEGGCSVAAHAFLVTRRGRRTSFRPGSGRRRGIRR